jgi:cell division protein FtsB
MSWNRVLLGVIIFINLVLVYRLIWSSHGVFAYRELRTHYTELGNKLEDLTSQTLVLSQEIRLLKSDRTYIEKMIRQHMNFVKPGEILYIFPNKSSEASPGAGQDDDQN